MLLPAPAMVLGQGVPALLDQLERHCLAPDASLVTKPVYLDLLQVTSFLPPSLSDLKYHLFLRLMAFDRLRRLERRCRVNGCDIWRLWSVHVFVSSNLIILDRYQGQMTPNDILCSCLVITAGCVWRGSVSCGRVPARGVGCQHRRHS